MRPNPSANRMPLIYFIFFIPDPKSPVGACMPTVFEYVCAFTWQIVNIRFEMRQLC